MPRGGLAGGEGGGLHIEQPCDELQTFLSSKARTEPSKKIFIFFP